MRATATIIGLTAAALLTGRAALAQEPAAQKPVPIRDTLSIPVHARPPAGMCRIWIDEVPVAQQPAPTDCAAAVRNKPARGRVLFGDDYVKRESTKVIPLTKGFAAPKDAKQQVKPVTKPPVR